MYGVLVGPDVHWVSCKFQESTGDHNEINSCNNHYSIGLISEPIRGRTRFKLLGPTSWVSEIRGCMWAASDPESRLVTIYVTKKWVVAFVVQTSPSNQSETVITPTCTVKYRWKRPATASDSLARWGAVAYRNKRPLATWRSGVSIEVADRPPTTATAVETNLSLPQLNFGRVPVSVDPTLVLCGTTNLEYFFAHPETSRPSPKLASSGSIPASLSSHAKKGWELFTDAVLNAVLDRANDTGRGVVFFAWGLPSPGVKYVKWATFDDYARRVRRLYAKTVTMNPHCIYSSIYKQLIHIRPNVELFPNLTTLGNSREKASHWVNIKAPEIEVVLWNPVMNRLFLDAPLPYTTSNNFKESRSNPALSTKTSCTNTLMHSPHLPYASLIYVLTQELAIASPECERSGDAMTQYTQLLMLLADKYRGVFRALKIQHPLLCHDQAGLESFLRTVRMLADAGVGTLQLNLIVGWQELTREVQDMIELSKWTVLRHFRITSRRASPSWPWTAGNAL
ncbi:hypothetical protein L210DRAFT_3631523 [Boletus edulis BED1]|uniref:Uncharacterized protein n=1 Tax=Boletus edulis BED1 TaxID=1328754 RepID=A0AAD4GEB9_BOLED|nr:hypothetical protein L210DRAFT_3631523 [Boletus edulis BED1]